MSKTKAHLCINVGPIFGSLALCVWIDRFDISREIQYCDPNQKLNDSTKGSRCYDCRSWKKSLLLPCYVAGRTIWLINQSTHLAYTINQTFWFHDSIQQPNNREWQRMTSARIWNQATCYALSPSYALCLVPNQQSLRVQKQSVINQSIDWINSNQPWKKPLLMWFDGPTKHESNKKGWLHGFRKLFDRLINWLNTKWQSNNNTCILFQGPCPTTKKQSSQKGSLQQGFEIQHATTFPNRSFWRLDSRKAWSTNWLIDLRQTTNGNNILWTNKKAIDANRAASARIWTQASCAAMSLHNTRAFWRLAGLPNTACFWCLAGLINPLYDAIESTFKHQYLIWIEEKT